MGKITPEMIAAAREVCIGFSGDYGEYNDYLSEDAALEVLMAALDAQPQGEPVALPTRKETSKRYAPDLDRHEAVEDSFNQGWNACLDEIAKLGPLYTHADPGEVERLSHLLGQARSMVNGATDEWHKSVAEVLKND